MMMTESSKDDETSELPENLFSFFGDFRFNSGKTPTTASAREENGASFLLTQSVAMPTTNKLDADMTETSVTDHSASKSSTTEKARSLLQQASADATECADTETERPPPPVPMPSSKVELPATSGQVDPKDSTLSRPLKNSEIKPWEVRVLSSGLRDCQQQRRDMMEYFKDETDRLKQQLEQTESQMEAQKKTLEEQKDFQIEELKSFYNAELANLQSEKSAELEEATRAAVRATQHAQEQLNAWRLEKAQLELLHEQVLSQAVEAVADEKAQIQKRFQAEVEHIRKESAKKVASLQGEFNMIEAELLDALNKIEEMEVEREEILPHLESQVCSLRNQLEHLKCAHEEELGALRVQLAQSQEKARETAAQLSSTGSLLQSKNAHLSLHISPMPEGCEHGAGGKVPETLTKGQKPELLLPRSVFTNTVSYGQLVRSPTSAFNPVTPKNRRADDSELAGSSSKLQASKAAQCVSLASSLMRNSSSGSKGKHADKKVAFQSQLRSTARSSKLIAPTTSSSINKKTALSAGSRERPENKSLFVEAKGTGSTTSCHGRTDASTNCTPKSYQSGGTGGRKPATTSVVPAGRQRSLLTKYGNKSMAGPTGTSRRPSRLHITDNADPATKPKDQLSPKELIQNVLNSLMPEQKEPEPRVPNTPEGSIPSAETIELTPDDPSSKNVGEKFESLFSDWSTAKKLPNNSSKKTSSSSSPDWTTNISVGWSTNKKTKRGDKENFCSSQKRLKKSLPQATPLRSTPRTRSQVEATPLFVRNELVALLSPEEMLLSPPDMSKQTITFRETSSQEPTDEQKRCLWAASKLQQWFRTLTQRRTFVRMICATVLLQSVARRNSVNKWYNKLEFGACLIQSHIRRTLVLRRVTALKGSALRIAAAFRGYVSRKLYQRITRSTRVIQRWNRLCFTRQTLVREVERRIRIRRAAVSATQVQALLRGYLGRKQLARSNVLTVHAVCRIQKFWRGQIQMAKIQKTERSAILIQSFGRRLLAQRSRNSSMRALVVVQACVRYFVGRSKYLVYRQASVKLQSLARGYSVRKAVSTMVRAVVVLQREWRVFALGLLVRKRSSAATLIQRLWYTRMESAALARKRASVVILQKLVRKSLAKHVLESLFSAKKNLAVVVQRCWRGRVERVCYQRELTAARFASIAMQRRWRAFSSRRWYLTLHGAVIKVQSIVRGRCDRRRFATLRRKYKAAVITLQSSWRRFSALSKFKRTVHSVVILQSHARKLFAQIILKRNLAALHLQSLWRGWKSRWLLTSMHDAATVLESSFRGFLVRRKLRCSAQAFTFIQAKWRGSCDRREFRRVRKSVVAVQGMVRARQAHAKLLNLQERAKQNCIQVSSDKANELQSLTRGRSSKQGRTRGPLLNIGATSDTFLSPILLTEENPQPKTRRQKQTRSRQPLGDRGSSTDTGLSPALSPVRTRRKMAHSTDKEGAENSKNRGSAVPSDVVKPAIGEDFEKFKVVELRELLVDRGVEKKTLRNLRKAELVELAQRLTV